MKVVILAGGKGTRLGLSDRPKPMVDIGGRPLLERLVETARNAGFIDIVFLTGHLANVIEDYFGDGARFGVHIEHVREDIPLGTAGAVRLARDLLTQPFILLYGDVLIDVDLAHLASVHQAHKGIGTLFVHPNDHPHDSDLIKVDEAGYIQAFLSKPHAPGQILPNLVNAAIYVLDPKVIEFVPDTGASDWAHDIFPLVLSAGSKLYAHRSVEYAKDVGTPERLARGAADLASGRVARLSRRNPKPAIFLDRDGVLNVEIGGVHRPEDLSVDADVSPAIRRINRAGIPAICVTNQPDIAKGLMDRDQTDAVFAALDTQLADGGAYLDDVYICPHHPESGWPGEVAALKIDCDCRKPKAGMLLAAARDHNLDLARSWMIGDRYVDVAAAHAAGVRAILVRTGHAGSDAAQSICQPDHVVDRLPDAVELVLKAMQ